MIIFPENLNPKELGIDAKHCNLVGLVWFTLKTIGYCLQELGSLLKMITVIPSYEYRSFLFIFLVIWISGFAAESM